jgi:MFS family permease
MDRTWLNLGLLFLIGSCLQQQQEAFGYLYGYVGSGVNMGNSHYEIASSFKNLTKYYGLLSGAGFSITFSVAGVFWGILSEKMSRKRIVGLSCLVWSMTNIITGNTNSLFVLAAMRAVLGVAQAAYEPAAYSLIADQVPKKQLPSANSAIIASLFMGGGLCALNILLISRVGWRMCLNIMGGIGLAIGGASLLLMKEPERVECGEDK